MAIARFAGLGSSTPRRRSVELLDLVSVPAFYAALLTAFHGLVRRWREDKPGGLAVVEIPTELVAGLGGRRQMRVVGTLNDAPFTGSTKLVAGGGLCVGVSKAALVAAGVSVGDDVDVTLGRADG